MERKKCVGWEECGTQLSQLWTYLLLEWFNMVAVDVCITKCVDEITRLE